MPIPVPGPKIRSPFAFMRDMSQDPLGYLESLREAHGDIVRLPFPFLPIFQITDPDLIGKVLLGTEKTNIKSLSYRALRPILGNNLVMASGDYWKRQRRLANPAFHPRMSQSFFENIRSATLDLADEWERRIDKNPIIDMSGEMSNITFRVISRALFSMDLSEDAVRFNKHLIALQEYSSYLYYSFLPLPLGVPTKRNRLAKQALDGINALVFDIIRKHKQDPGSYKDLLSVFIASRDEETGEAMTDGQLRDEVITLMMAGHDTTAFTLTMAFEYIARDSHVLDRMLSEFESTGSNSLTLESLSAFPFSEQVFLEATRLFPALYAVSRELTEPLIYKDYLFPKGSYMLLSQYITHRHPHLWKQPNEFRPDRFHPTAAQGRHPFAFFPFGGGVRTCIGSNLAKMEAMIIMSVLLQRFKIERVVDQDYRIVPKMSLVALPGIKMRISRK